VQGIAHQIATAVHQHGFGVGDMGFGHDIDPLAK
jgi:hypothetical protein